MPQGAIFLALFLIIIVATFTAFGMVLFGMRGEAPEAQLKPDTTYDRVVRTA
jgi:hypothetical protein